MKSHLICVFSVLFFIRSLLSQKKFTMGFVSVSQSRWMQLGRGTAFPRTWCRVVLITSLMLRREGPPISRTMCWHLCLSKSMRVYAMVASAKKGAKASYLSSFLLNSCLCLWPCLCLWKLYFRTDVMVLTNFTSTLETNRFFLQHLCCACVFYFIPPFLSNVFIMNWVTKTSFIEPVFRAGYLS